MAPNMSRWLRSPPGSNPRPLKFGKFSAQLLDGLRGAVEDPPSPRSEADYRDAEQPVSLEELYQLVTAVKEQLRAVQMVADTAQAEAAAASQCAAAAEARATEAEGSNAELRQQLEQVQQQIKDLQQQPSNQNEEDQGSNGAATAAATATAEVAPPPDPPSAASFMADPEVQRQMLQVEAVVRVRKDDTAETAVGSILAAAGLAGDGFAEAVLVSGTTKPVWEDMEDGPRWQTARFTLRTQQQRVELFRQWKSSCHGHLFGVCNNLNQQLTAAQRLRKRELRATAAFKAVEERAVQRKAEGKQSGLLWLLDGCAVDGVFWTVEYARALDAAAGADGG